MKICVFGASSSQIPHKYLEAGTALGKAMAEKGMELIFGGGATGMMGAVLQGIKAGGGKSTGVSPRFFDQPHMLSKECDNFLFTDSMRERKGIMEDMADGFIVTPGSIGTLEELFEVYVLNQLEQMDKPIALFNVDGFFDPLLSMLKELVVQHFLSRESFDLLFVSDSIPAILDHLDHAC